MNEANIVDTKPLVLELEPGTYWWCSCGQSSTQPDCDGSHQGTGFAPVKLDVAEKKTVAFCQCKQTGNPPVCDGSHSKL